MAFWPLSVTGWPQLLAVSRWPPIECIELAFEPRLPAVNDETEPCR